MKKTTKTLFFLTPIALWLGCSLVVLAPDVFNQSRMADMAIFWFFGIFTNPIELFSILGDFDHPAIQAILVFLLLVPLAIWVVWPLTFRTGLTTRSYIYLCLLLVYILPGALLSGARHRSITRAHPKRVSDGVFSVRCSEFRRGFSLEKLQSGNFRVQRPVISQSLARR